MPITKILLLYPGSKYIPSPVVNPVVKKEISYKNPFHYDTFEVIKRSELYRRSAFLDDNKSLLESELKEKRMKYKCQLCNRDVPEDMVLDHYELHKKIADQSEEYDAEEIIKCPLCHIEFKNLKNYDLHVKRKHETSKFFCKECNEQFDNEYYLSVHMATHSTNPGLFVCCKCHAFTTYDQSQLVTHMNSAHYEDTSQQFYCDDCEKYFMSETWFNDHKIFHVRKKTFLCAICQLIFPKLPVFKAHMEKEHKIAVMDTSCFRCNLCDLTFPQNRNLRLHNKKIHPPSSLCPICGKVFARKDCLAVHMKIHDVGKFICSVCGKRFKKSANMNIHMRIHTGEKPYSCHLCQKSFSQIQTLKIHLRIHSGDRPYPCEKCQKGFVTKTVRDSHQKCCKK